MTLTPQQQQALFALADAIRLAAEAFGNQAEAVAERLAIQTEPEPTPPYSVEDLRAFLNHVSKERGRSTITAILGQRKAGDLNEAERIALRDEIKLACNL